MHLKHFLSTKILFLKFSFFENFVKFDLILFYFIFSFFFINFSFERNFVMNNVHEPGS